MATRKPKLKIDDLAIEEHLHAIEQILPEGYVLTLVCRYTPEGDADIIMSRDDFDLAVDCISRWRELKAFEAGRSPYLPVTNGHDH